MMRRATTLLLYVLAILPGFARAEPPALVVGTTAVANGIQARTSREHVQGLQLWVDEVNARGGLRGRKLVLRHRDDGGDADTAARAFEQLLVEDAAELVVGPYAPELTAAVAAVAERHDIPLIAPGATSPALWTRGSRNLFGLYTLSTTSLDPVLEFAKRRGLRRVALVYQRAGFARELADSVKERLAGLGMYVVLDSAYDATQTDFAETIKSLRAKRPDVLLVGGYLPDSVAFARAAREQKIGAGIVVFSGGAHLAEFGKEAGAAADGVMGLTQWEPMLGFAAAAEFTRRYKTRFGYEPGLNAVGGYAAGQVLEAAVSRAGGTERAALRRALLDLDVTTALGRFKVDAVGRQIGKNAYVVQWIGGARVPVLPDMAAGRKPAYPFGDWSKR